jgi:3-oxoadipate enol-lactonase
VVSEDAIVPLEQGFATASFGGPEGAPYVVVVPPLGMPAGVLDPFVARLAERLRVVVVELPGAGHASAAPPAVTTRELGASLARVLATLHLVPCHLFGISLSGMVAQWVAIDAGGAIDRLVLASTAARGLDVALSEPLEKLALARRLITGGPTRAAMAEAIVSDEVREDPAEMERIAHEMRSAPREDLELAWLGAAAALHDARDQLGEITRPTLVLTGEHDELVPPAVQDELARAIRGAERAFVLGAGHDVTLDRPDETARLVLDFLLAEAP